VGGRRSEARGSEERSKDEGANKVRGEEEVISIKKKKSGVGGQWWGGGTWERRWGRVRKEMN